MPAVVSCPKCQRKSRLPDNLMGKKVKCPGCGQVFVPSVEDPAPAPVEKPKPVAPKKVAPKNDEDEAGGYEVVEEKRAKRRRKDDDDDDERVSERPSRRRTADDDEDEDEDRSRRRRLDDDDEDEDEEDRPRRRRPRPKVRRRRGSSSSSGDVRTPLIALGIVGGICLLLAVGSFAVPALARVSAILGNVIMIGGGLWFLVVAFQDEVWHGLLCLCLPFYSLYYLITHWDTTWKPFCVQMIGLVVAMVGGCAGAGGMGEGVPNPQPPPRPRMQLQAPLVVAMKAPPSV